MGENTAVTLTKSELNTEIYDKIKETWDSWRYEPRKKCVILLDKKKKPVWKISVDYLISCWFNEEDVNWN